MIGAENAALPIERKFKPGCHASIECGRWRMDSRILRVCGGNGKNRGIPTRE